MATVVLEKAAIEPLTVEATRSMETSIEKCYRFRSATQGGWQERNLLACADVLGALERASLAFGDFDHTIPDGDRPETVFTEFTEEAIRWMSWTRDLTQEYVDHPDPSSAEGEPDGCQREEFLLYVLNRVLGSEREAVTA